MTDHQRSDPSNSIWLCVECATKIDKDEFKFPVDLLNGWKANHEAWVSAGCLSEQEPLHEDTVKDGGVGAVLINDGPGTALDSDEFWAQRKRLPETAIIKKIWSKPHWRICICPTEFKTARFRDLEECQQFASSSQVPVQDFFRWYPWVSNDSLEIDNYNEWIAGEIDRSDGCVSHAERWTLFRSGQFVYNRAFYEVPQPADRVGAGPASASCARAAIHVLEILDTVTATFEFASQMAHRGVLSPVAAITFELHEVDGRELTWPDNASGNSIGPDCWCRERAVDVNRRIPPGVLEQRRRELARKGALDIYSKFGWSDPPEQRLADQQKQRFVAAQ